MSVYDQFFLAGQYLAPHRLVSGLYGLAAECRMPAAKNWMIDTFIRRYGVDMSEALIEDPHGYDHFNAFFTRALKPGARAVSSSKNAIVCPADGAISQIGPIDQDHIFQAKGHRYTVTDLLGGSPQRAEPFQDGYFATVYLAPKDYHRVHMPLTGTLREMVYVPGRQFSVSPLTARAIPGLFARNERVVCVFDTECGPMAVVLVGAMIVASIETVWAGLVTPRGRTVQSTRYAAPCPAITLGTGDELGRFKLGSTVIVLFGKDRADWTETLCERKCVRMGETLASAKPMP